MASYLYRYEQLSRLGSHYCRRMERLRCRILSIPPTDLSDKDRRVVHLLSESPRHKSPDYVDYYPRLYETYHLMVRLREVGLYRNEFEDFKEEMCRLRRLRGKGPKPIPAYVTKRGKKKPLAESSSSAE